MRLLLVLLCLGFASSKSLGCRQRCLSVRGGKTEKKVRKLDPRGTSLSARAARPLVGLVTRYENALEENPKLELYVQIGGTLFVMQVIKALVKAYGDHRHAALFARALYLCFLLSHQALLSAVKARVEAENDETPLTIPGNPLLASVASRAQQESGGQPNPLLKSLLERQTTVRDYDLEMVEKGRKSQIGSIVAMSYLHLKRGFLQPLVLQSVMGFLALLKDPLFQIHLFGRPATGALSRPFVPAQPAWIKAMAPPPPQDQEEEAVVSAEEEVVEVTRQEDEGDEEYDEEYDDDEEDDDEYEDDDEEYEDDDDEEYEEYEDEDDDEEE